MLSRLSESAGMGTWQIIESALENMKPRRTPVWLAEQLGVSIQVVSNWKNRAVPASRRRDIATALGLTMDQLDGLAALPWEEVPESSALTKLFPDVASVAVSINQLPKKQRDWVLGVVRSTIDAAKATIPSNANDVTHQSATPVRKRGNG
jgi:DNA-binding transcriptional regulator YdaS (Cro superfamily)